MKYIGRKYIPIDNSYSLNVTNPIALIKNHHNLGPVLNRGYLSGTANSNPIICIVLSNPFIATVLNWSGKERIEREMIMVKNTITGDCNIVMYHEDGFKVKERIKAINEHNKRNHSSLPEMTL